MQEVRSRKRNLSSCFVCRALATLRHSHLGSFFFDPENVRNLTLEAIWNFIQGQDSHYLEFRLQNRGPLKGLCASGLKGLEPTFYSFVHSTRSAMLYECRFFSRLASTAVYFLQYQINDELTQLCCMTTVF